MIFLKLSAQIFNKNKLLYTIIIITLVVLNLFVSSFVAFICELNADKILVKGLSDNLLQISNMTNDELNIDGLSDVKGLFGYRKNNSTYGIKGLNVYSYDYDLITQLNVPIISGQNFEGYDGDEFPLIVPQVMGANIGETITMEYDSVQIKYKVIGIIDNYYPYFNYNKGGNNLEIHELIRWMRASSTDIEYYCISLTKWKDMEINNLGNQSAYIEFDHNISKETYETNLSILQEKYLINEMSVMKEQLNNRVNEEILKFIPVLVVFVLIAVIGLFIMSYFFIRDSLYITNIFRIHGASPSKINMILIGFMLVITIINLVVNLVLARFMTNPLVKMQNINITNINIIITLCIMSLYWIVTWVLYTIMTRHTVSTMLKEGN